MDATDPLVIIGCTLYLDVCHVWRHMLVGRFSETVGRFSVNNLAIQPLGRNILPCPREQQATHAHMYTYFPM